MDPVTADMRKNEMNTIGTDCVGLIAMLLSYQQIISECNKNPSFETMICHDTGMKFWKRYFFNDPGQIQVAFDMYVSFKPPRSNTAYIFTKMLLGVIQKLTKEAGEECDKPDIAFLEYALKAACARGDIGTVHMLLNADIRNEWALYTAVKNGRLEVVQLLLNYGILDHGNTILEYSVKGGFTEITHELLNVNFRNEWILYMASKMSDIDTVRVILNHNILDYGSESLGNSSKQGCPEITREIMSRGIRNEWGLYWASKASHVATVRVILESEDIHEHLEEALCAATNCEIIRMLQSITE